MSFAPPPITLRQLQYAVAVADTASFRRAAELCFVSQPALSAQLQELERALSVRLFERDKKRVLLNPAAAPVIERARQLLLAADDLVAVARGIAEPLTGTLRIGIIPTISQYWLPSAVPKLKKHFPRLRVVWSEDKTDVLMRRLHAGELDAALVALEATSVRPHSSAGPREVEHAIVGKDPFVLATPSSHPLGKAKSPVALDALAGADVLLLDEGHCLREQALAACAKQNVEEIGFRATSLPTLVQMVASGAGVTLLPALAVETERRRGNIAVRPFKSPPFRTLAFVWRKQSPLGPALRELAEKTRGN